MPHDVFISHSSRDGAVAGAVCAALEGARVSCWVAPRDVQPGRPFAGEITRAIQHSKVMVLIFSANSNSSPQVLREVELAVNRNVHIVQLRTEQVPLGDDLKYYLSAPHWLDAVTPPFGQHLPRLIAAVRALLLVQDERRADDRLPSHCLTKDVELADATLFSATVELSSKPGSKEEFFAKLEPLLANFLSDKAADVVTAMVEREAILSTGTGFGLGFPHGYRPYIKRFVAGIVVVPGGCDWHAADDNPVFTVLPYVGGGGGRTTQALRIMGAAHRVVSNILSRRALGSPDTETLTEIISSVRQTFTKAGLSVSFVSFQ